MVTTHQKITLGTSSLQGFWIQAQSDNQNENARNHPDRRLSVCDQGCGSKSTDTAHSVGMPGSSHSNSDSLLGSLLIESFVGAAFTPLLPVWAQAVDWSLAAEAADTAWLDRRSVSPAPAPMSLTPRPAVFGLF